MIGPGEVSSDSDTALTGINPIPAVAGIGLRYPHHHAVLETQPAVGWLEIHAENYLSGSAAARQIAVIRRDYPLSLHGVGLSLGGAGGLDVDHLRRIGALARWLQPDLISEHLSWSTTGGEYLADLLPLPMTEEALEVVCRHVEQTQDFLHRQILIENPSTYLRYRHSTIPEEQFLIETARRTGCRLLCDVNNIYVSAWNNGFDPAAYLATLPPGLIGEIHLAGHAEMKVGAGRSLRIDVHGSAVSPEVWALYVEAIRRFGRVPTLIEWDTEIPALDVLLTEAAEADRLLDLHGRSLAHVDAA